MARYGTTQLRNEYGPGCLPVQERVNISLHGEGRITVARVAADAFRALNACLVKHRYATRRLDTGAYNCRKITGGSGLSLHSFGIAADLNWQSNPYGPRLVTDMPRGMREDIKAIRTRSGEYVFRWGGDYSGNKDAMHYEVVCSLADLLSGIDPRTVPGAVVALPGAPNVATRQRTPGTYRKGDTGPGVWLLQGMLNATRRYHGGPLLVTDGIFGTATETALTKFEHFGRGMQALAGNTKTITTNGVAGRNELGSLKFWVDTAR
jgi:hypothetical protein